MKRPILHAVLAAVVVGSALAAFASAQETPASTGLQPLRPIHGQEDPLLPGAPQPLRPLAPQQGSAQAPPQPVDWDLQIRTDLTQLDLDARMESFDDLRGAAATDAEARRAMEAISKDSTDPDLAFLARLALREPARAQVRTSSPFSRRSGRGASPSAPRSGVSIDPFGGSSIFEIFENDPFFSGRSRRGMGGGDPFEDMRREFDEIRRRHDEMRQRMFGGASPFGPGTSQAPGSSRSVNSSRMSFEMTPDGVKVTIIEDDGSGPVEKSYEAPSKEALLEAHPELRERMR